MNKEEKAKIFKAFCDANRLAILDILQNGEKCACELLEALSIGQSTLSHHMKILCDANIVLTQKVGKSAFYRLNAQGLSSAVEILSLIKEVENPFPANLACAIND